MQKTVLTIFGIFLFACIAACSSSGTTSTPVAVYDLPTGFAPYSSSKPHLMGGSIQGGTISAKFSNYSVSTLAGTAGSAGGFSNYSSTSSTKAKFNQPNEITFDGINLYVADYGNNAIRQVTPLGVVKTLPIGFINRPSGITSDGTNLYVVANGSNTVSIIAKNTWTVDTIGSTTGLAGSIDSTTPADVRFNQPTGITTDGVNLYVTDSGNHTVRRIVIATKAVSTLAGNSGLFGSSDGVQGAALFYLPWRITTDGSKLYLSDFRNHTIRQIDILTGLVTTIAGSPGPLGHDSASADGDGTAARFNQPNGITTDGTFLYVTDSYENTLRKINKSAPYTVTTIPVPGGLLTPIGITTDGTSLFVTDTYTVYRNPKTYVDTYSYSNSILKLQ